MFNASTNLNNTNPNTMDNANCSTNADTSANANSSASADTSANANSSASADTSANPQSSTNLTGRNSHRNANSGNSSGNASLRAQLERSLGIETRSDATRRDLLYPELSHAIVGACIEVHRHVGPGQLESVYQLALSHELHARRLSYRAQVPLTMTYKGQPVGEFYADFIVDEKIVLELKAVERTLPVHTAQVISYLRAAQLRLGLLINFNVPVLFRGVKRIVL